MDINILPPWEELRSISGSAVYPPHCVILPLFYPGDLLLSESTDGRDRRVWTNDLSK